MSKRQTIIVVAALALAATPVGTALAAAGPSAGDLAAAHAVVQSPAVLAQVGRFFAHDGAPGGSSTGSGTSAGGTMTPADEARAAAQAAPRPVGATVPVYTLDPSFVAGAPGAAVARPDFTATEVTAADGRTASVWTVQQNGSWRVVNIASGSDETDYAARGAAGGGGTVFREPQLNAWYVLRGGRVLPLDAEARSSVGAGGESLAAYQKLVHQRYGDKLPGSAYDRAGLGGGFSTEATAGPAVAPVAAPSPSRVAPITAAGALVVTGLAGAGLAVRRRRVRG
ncbi:hypothetical protein [Kitasatospora viridis]|uniref:LPXTG-motif cell wall-anchored protein n=1 Tax=Kitasatospora viridis TaxID=281105 RepID=A0A561UFN5_9ACTN|nr:hypothetical protein [Kitasatospora viridis]TWF98172.1 hypothetical protein FHX73_111975 [Kitasatospora viridis]